MEVLSFLVLFIVFALITFLAFYDEYKRSLKKYKPEYFGLDTFHRVTRWQSSDWQSRAIKKGITLVEWQSLCDQKLSWIETALEDQVTIRGAV